MGKKKKKVKTLLWPSSKTRTNSSPKNSQQLLARNQRRKKIRRRTTPRNLRLQLTEQSQQGGCNTSKTIQVNVQREQQPRQLHYQEQPTSQPARSALSPS